MSIFLYKGKLKVRTRVDDSAKKGKNKQRTRTRQETLIDIAERSLVCNTITVTVDRG